MVLPVDDGAPQPLGVRALARRASALGSSTIASVLVSVPSGFVAARWLGPHDFGRAQWVLLVYFYASLARAGAFEAGVRSYIDQRARGDDDRGRRDRDVGVTLESIVALVPGLLLLTAAAFSDDDVRVAGFLLAPVATVASSVNGYIGGLHLADQRAAVVARATFARSVVASAGALVGASAIGPVGVVIAPIVADVVTVGLYRMFAPRLGIKPTVDVAVARRLLRTGFPLGAAAVVYWAYRLIGSTSVAALRSDTAFGLFTFAATPVALASRALSSAQAVLMPALWTSMATDRRDRRWVADADRVTLLVAIVAAAVTNAGQAAFGPALAIVAPGFSDAIPLFEILAFNVFLLVVASVPSQVLDSATVNQQGRHLAVWSAALAVNAIANLAVLAAGAGLVAVAVNEIWVQAALVLVISVLAAPHMRADDRAPIARRLAIVVVVMVVVAAALRLLPSQSSSLAGASAIGAGRLAGVGLAWVAVASVVRGRWLARRR